MVDELIYFALFSTFFLCVLILPVVFVFYTIRILNYVEALLMNAPDAFVNALIGDGLRSPPPDSPILLCHSSCRLFRSLPSLFAQLTQTFAFFANCHADLGNYDSLSALDEGVFVNDNDGFVDGDVEDEEEVEEEEAEEEQEEGSQLCFTDRWVDSSEEVSSEGLGGKITNWNDVNEVIGNAGRPEPREVSFDVVQIREYEVVRCHHPRRKGIALTLGERHLGTKSVGLDDYEASKVYKGVNQLSFAEKVERLREMETIFKVGESAFDESAKSRKVQTREYKVLEGDERRVHEVMDWSEELRGSGPVEALLEGVVDWSDAFEKLFGIDGACEFDVFSLGLQALFQDEVAREREAEMVEAGESRIIEEEGASGSVQIKSLLEDVVDWSEELQQLFEVNGADEFEDFSLSFEALFQDKASCVREPFMGSMEMVGAGEAKVEVKECSCGSASSQGFSNDMVDWSDSLPTLFELQDVFEFEDFGFALEALFREPRRTKRRRGFRSRKTTDVLDWAISMEELFETPLLRRSARLKAKPLINYAGM